MCAIVGALVTSIHTQPQRDKVNKILAIIWNNSFERGRDGCGWYINTSREMKPTVYLANSEALTLPAPEVIDINVRYGVMIGNVRAEPTTEYVKDKKLSDQQPYTSGKWSIVHNGTIANDKELRTGNVPTGIDSAAIVEHLNGLEDRVVFPTRFDYFKACILDLKGSYAILAAHEDEPNVLYAAANYRPIWHIKDDVYGYFFASARDYFPAGYVPKMVEPYTAMKFESFIEPVTVQLRPRSFDHRALVVCSGGLDSVVAATYAQSRMGYEIELIHFMYGSRAEGPEVKAVEAVALALGCKVTLFPLPVYKPGDSPLLDANAAVAGGEAGAEFAHEWVPARNLLLLSVATAYAEAQGIETLVLGNNLEEAGAYPDNEPEFIAKFNDLLPFAVGDGKRMKVIMPVGNMMKHEIVALGARINAPMHLTWSCYRPGKLHCGKCGPCFMRRTAFYINKLPEVIEYVPVN